MSAPEREWRTTGEVFWEILGSIIALMIVSAFGALAGIGAALYWFYRHVKSVTWI